MSNLRWVVYTVYNKMKSKKVSLSNAGGPNDGVKMFENLNCFESVNF
jgi:hypothetical protein